MSAMLSCSMISFETDSLTFSRKGMALEQMDALFGVTETSKATEDIEMDVGDTDGDKTKADATQVEYAAELPERS